MSASFVRTTVRAWAQDVAALVGVAFYDTINRSHSPADAVWWTVAYQADEMDGDSFCAGPNYLEAGGVKVTVFAAPGNGDTDAVDALERIVRALMDKVDPTQRLVWRTFEPVFEDSGGSADATYRVGVWLNYHFRLTH